MPSFTCAFETGTELEDFVMSQIKTRLGAKVVKNENNSDLKKYDIIVNDAITIECKHDLRSITTQNICIESHCYDKKSGILATTADYWVISNGIRSFLIRTSRIRECIEDGYTSQSPNSVLFEHKKDFMVEQEPGVYKPMSFYLIPITLFSPYCDEVGGVYDLTYQSIKQKMS